MGVDCCGNADPGSAAVRIPHLDKMYREKNLPLSDITSFKNKFEHDFFMTFNLLRTNPSEFQTYVKNYMATGNCKTHPVAAKVLIGKLKDSEGLLGAVTSNTEARDACFTNLSRQIGTAKDYEGGAITEIKNGKDCKINLDTCTLEDHLQVSWEGSALELIVHMLLIFYGDRENTGKVSPILNP